MSVYGGDSWVPETVHRKRRVEELLSDGVDEREVRRLPNGHFACLVCPRCPVLDTFLMLSMHRNGARHRAAALKLQEKDFRLQNQIQKRRAIAASSTATRNCSGQIAQSSDCPSPYPISSPLLTATRKHTTQALAYNTKVGTGIQCLPIVRNATCPSDNAGAVPEQGQKRQRDIPFFSPLCPKGVGRAVIESKASTPELQYMQKQNLGKASSCRQKRKTATVFVRSEMPAACAEEQQQLRKQRERQLQLREAGWRRDGFGNWFKEENVEFDSDEETPEGGS